MSDDQQTTRDRLLESAEKLFSQHGYDGVTVRDLAAAAGVNVAAVNYHFQGKENLYQEVLLRLIQATREQAIESIASVTADGDGTPDPEELVSAYVSNFFQKAMKIHNGDSHLSLLIREMHDFRCGGKSFFTKTIVPINMAFSSALGQACPRLDEDQIKWVISSIMGQIIHLVMRWHRCHQVFADDPEIGQMMRMVFPPLASPAEEYIVDSIRHITAFTLGGIRQLENEG